MLTVLVPAHNEGEQIADTIESLLAQTVPADRIVVIPNNCTDDTAEIASRYPVIVHDMPVNPHRKSGAMVEGWKLYCQDADYVFTMDADTILAPDFFELSLNLMESDPTIGGASACPMLKDMPEDASFTESLIWRASRIDFGGYLRILLHWKFTPQVLSGYGTIFRADALQDIAAEIGAPWDLGSIVEDYKISLDLRRLGWGLKIIRGALAFTDAPTTLKGLWTQRVRWSGGTWQELARAGWKPYTRKTWLISVACVGSFLMRFVALAAFALFFLSGQQFVWSLFWLVPIAVGVLDRLDMIRYTRGADRKDVLLVAALLPLELMGLLRESWTVHSAVQVSRGKILAWG